MFLWSRRRKQTRRRSLHVAALIKSLCSHSHLQLFLRAGVWILFCRNGEQDWIFYTSIAIKIKKRRFMLFNDIRCWIFNHSQWSFEPWRLHADRKRCRPSILRTYEYWKILSHRIFFQCPCSARAQNMVCPFYSQADSKPVGGLEWGTDPSVSQSLMHRRWFLTVFHQRYLYSSCYAHVLHCSTSRLQ